MIAGFNKKLFFKINDFKKVPKSDIACLGKRDIVHNCEIQRINVDCKTCQNATGM